MRTILLLAVLSLCRSAVPQQWLDVTPVPMEGPTTADPAHGRIVTLPERTATVFEWDSGAWSGAVSFPPGRSGPVVGYDAATRKVICVFRTRAAWETWLLDDRTWTRMNVPTPAVDRLVTDPVNGGLLGEVLNGSQAQQLSWDGVQWRTLAPAPGPDLVSCGLVADTQRGCVLAFGGSSPLWSNDTWQWNGNTWQLLQPPHRPSARIRSGMSLDLTTGNVVLHGGRQLQGNPLRDTWIWNGSDWLATATTLMPDVATGSQRIEFDRTRNAVVLFGTDVGGDARGYQWTGTDWVILPDCETPSLLAVTEDIGRRRIVGITELGVREHDGYRWLRPASIGGPTQRIRCPLAYFPGTHTLLFGGDALPRGDTWTWDGTAWTPHWTGPQPPARNEHGLAWHPASGGVIMFGGHGSNAPLGDTWLWNGATWQDLTPSLAASPPPGLGGGLGLDLPTGELLMLDPAQAGTWVWNGSWQNRTTTTVPALPRRGLYVGRDPATFHLVITGHFGAAPNGEVWQWSGTDWHLIAALPSGENRVAADSVHGQLMVFGDQHFVLTNLPAGVTRSGSGCGTPPPRLDRAGARPQLGRVSFGLRLLDAPPATPVAFAVDLAQAATPLPGGCTLLLANPQTLALAVANANGHAQAGLPVPLQAALVGLRLHAQGVVLAAPGPFLGMLRLSDRLTLTVGF